RAGAQAKRHLFHDRTRALREDPVRQTAGEHPEDAALVARAAFGNTHLAKPDFKNMPSKRAVMETLAQMMETGTVTPVVARTFPLDDVLAAMHCMQDGLVPGRIVLTP